MGRPIGAISKRTVRLSNQRGWTLLELMIAMVILTTAVLSLMASFGNIAKSIQMSKSKTLATNLAQEKIESLKNLSYYRLLSTTHTATSSEPGITAFFYDDSTYPSETLVVGDINFTRRVYIQKVSETAGTIAPIAWIANDTGLKKITCYVLWQQNSVWKKVEQSNVRDNPDRLKIDATISGTVVRSPSSPAIQDASIFVLQNTGYRATTDASGTYSINVQAGTYDVRASKLGYFPQTLTRTVTSNNTVNASFALTLKGFGTVTGTAYLNDHLVISQVIAGYSGTDMLEGVELYNPTESPYVLFDGTNPSYFIRFTNTATGVSVDINPVGTTKYVQTTIPAHGYFVIASDIAVTPEAYYSDLALVANFPDNRIPIQTSGGIALVSNGVYETAGSTVDAIGWGRTGGSPYGPSNSREGTGFQLPGGPAHNGIDADESLQRMAYSSSTHSNMDYYPTQQAHSLSGNSYDSNDNSTDWVYHNHGNLKIHGTGDILMPWTGTPAIGGLVFIDDGLSSTGMVGTSPSKGSFSVTNVATGTWSVLVSSKGWVHSGDGLVVTNGATVSTGSVLLNAPATGGFIAGRVVDTGGNPITPILVTAGGESDTTDTLGYYWLSLDTGPYIVTANPNNSNTLYTEAPSSVIDVTLGNLVTAAPLTLYQGGNVRGFVSTNGTDPLPGIPIIATNTAGSEVGSTISDSQGNFSFPDLRSGVYTLTPQLAAGESSSPLKFTPTISAASNIFVGTFTVSNAFGTIAGTVKTSGGQSIDTGILIIAVPSPTTIGSNPPSNTNGLRTGSIVYYQGTSESDGTYSLSVRGGTTYNVYAWYTTFNGTTPSTTPQSASATVSAGNTTPVNFTW